MQGPYGRELLEPAQPSCQNFNVYNDRAQFVS